MTRVGLAPEMMARLGIVFAAAICIPALVHGIVLNTPAKHAAVITTASEKIAVNPYGTISPSTAFARRDQRIDPSELTQMLRPKSKGVSATPGRMPIGCDALGGVSTGLAHVPGKCLT